MIVRMKQGWKKHYQPRLSHQVEKLRCYTVLRQVTSILLKESIKRKFSGFSRKFITSRKNLKSSNLSVFTNKNAQKKDCLVNPFITDIKNNVFYVGNIGTLGEDKGI